MKKFKKTVFILILCVILPATVSCMPKHGHSWSDGVCTVCNAVCGHSWQDGICNICYTACKHNYSDGICTECGENCKHIWNDKFVCKLCGFETVSVKKPFSCKSVNGNIVGEIHLPEVFQGKLKTVIISHGFNVHFSSGMARLLAKCGYACCVFDFCGGSIVTQSDMKFEDMTILTEKSDLTAVFNAVKDLPFVNGENIYLYGESQGGLVTAITAVDLLEEVAGLVLMYPGFSIVSDIAMRYPEYDKIPDRITVIGNNTLKRSYADAVYEFLPENFSKITDDGDIMQQRLEVTAKLYEYVAEYQKEVLIFHGTEDRLVDIAFSRQALKYYKNARLIELTGVQHGLGPIELSSVAREIDSFIRGKGV